MVGGKSKVHSMVLQDSTQYSVLLLNYNMVWSSGLDRFFHPVVSTLADLLRHLTGSTYYVLDIPISLFTWVLPISNVYIDGSYGIVLSYYQGRFNFSFKVASTQQFPYTVSFVCLLQDPFHCFSYRFCFCDFIIISFLLFVSFFYTDFGGFSLVWVTASLLTSPELF